MKRKPKLIVGLCELLESTVGLCTLNTHNGAQVDSKKLAHEQTDTRPHLNAPAHLRKT